MGDELRERLRELLRTIRVVRRHTPPHLVVPPGMAGLLAAIAADGRASVLVVLLRRLTDDVPHHVEGRPGRTLEAAR